jgi:hypothetical protein
MLSWLNRGQPEEDSLPLHNVGQGDNQSQARTKSTNQSTHTQKTQPHPQSLQVPSTPGHSHLRVQTSPTSPANPTPTHVRSSLDASGNRSVHEAEAETEPGENTQIFTDGIQTPYDGVFQRAHNDVDAFVASIPQHLLNIPDNVPDKIYDPYSGELKHAFVSPTLNPDPPPSGGGSRRPSAEGSRVPSETREKEKEIEVDSADIWSRLSHIRDLQSEVSRLHLQMEGIGPSNHFGSRTGGTHRRNRSKVDLLTSKASKAPSIVSGIGSGEYPFPLDDAEDKDADFQRLAGRLRGREEDIERIMERLGVLADAVGDFHALQMPVVKLEGFPPSSAGPRTAVYPYSPVTGAGGRSATAASLLRSPGNAGVSAMTRAGTHAGYERDRERDRDRGESLSPPRATLKRNSAPGPYGKLGPEITPLSPAAVQDPPPPPHHPMKITDSPASIGLGLAPP